MANESTDDIHPVEGDPPHLPVDADAMRRAGERLAKIGADAYSLADQYPWLEQMPDFHRMMLIANNLSCRLINGIERDA